MVAHDGIEANRKSTGGLEIGWRRKDQLKKCVRDYKLRKLDDICYTSKSETNHVVLQGAKVASLIRFLRHLVSLCEQFRSRSGWWKVLERQKRPVMERRPISKRRKHRLVIAQICGCGQIFHGIKPNEHKISHRWRACALLDSQLSSKHSQLSLVQEPAIGCIAGLDGDR